MKKIHFLYIGAILILYELSCFLLISNFSLNILLTDSLSNGFGDMWAHLMRGSLEATPEAIQLEGFIINEKVYAYPLPLPAFVRGLFSIINLQSYAIPSFLLATLIFGISVIGIVFNVSKLLNPNKEVDWLYPWIPLFLLPPLTLMISIKIYWEAAIWGLSIFALAIYCFTRFQNNKTNLNFFTLIIVISLMLFTRPTYVIASVGIFIYLILFDFINKKFFARQLIYILFICSILLLGLLNYYKWGNVFEFMPMQFNGHYLAGENGLRAIKAAEQPSLSLLRVPEAIDYYFGITAANFSKGSPFLIAGKSMLPFELAYFDYREHYYSLTLGMPIYLLLAVLGAYFIFKNFHQIQYKTLGPIVFITAIPAALMLLLMILAGRYRAEFYLFLLVLVCVALNDYCRSLSKLKNILFATTVTLISAMLIFNNIMVERKSIFDCQPGVIPRVLNDFYKCPPLNLPALTKQSPIDFSSSGIGKYYLIHGWSSAEKWGVWSTGNRSELRIPVQGGLDSATKEIIVSYKPFISYPGLIPFGEILANGNRLDPKLIDNELGKLYIPYVKNGAFNEEFTIVFNYENPKSPAELGIGSDDRKLAIGLLQIHLK